MARGSFKSGPIAITAGAANWWLRNNTFSGNVASVPDVLTGAFAVAGTNPPTGNADGTISCSAGNKALIMPLSAANNGTLKWWISMHLRTTSIAVARNPLAIDTPGSLSSARKLLWQAGAGTATYAMFVFDATSTVARKASVAPLTLNTWAHITIELALNTGASESLRCVIAKDGVIQSLTFADGVGAPGNTPVSMPAPTGNMALLAETAAGLNGFVGDCGRNIIGGNSAMVGATEGCLTPTARAALSAFERPS